MPGIDPVLPDGTWRVIAKPTPLRTRLAAVHGDADLAAKLLDEAARGFHLDIERLLVTHERTENAPAAARRGLPFGLARARNTRSLPALAVVPSPAAQST